MNDCFRNEFLNFTKIRGQKTFVLVDGFTNITSIETKNDSSSGGNSDCAGGFFFVAVRFVIAGDLYSTGRLFVEWVDDDLEDSLTLALNERVSMDLSGI